MEHHRGEGSFFFWLLAGAFALSAFVFLPYLNAVVLSGTFAIVFMPIHRGLSRLMGGYEGFAAFLTVLLVILVIFVPLALLGAQLFNEATTLYSHLSNASEPGPAVVAFTHWLARYDVHIDISPTTAQVNEYIRAAVRWTLNNLGSVFSGFLSALGFLFLSLLGLYYFLRDGKRFGAALVRLTPVPPNYTRAIFEKLHGTVNAVVRGTLAVAVAQGLIAGFGFWVFGVPSPIFWGSLAVIASLIPVLGTALVMVPAVIYLILSEKIALAVGLAIWSSLAVGLIDNILRPYVVERGVNIHPFLILISVLGGLEFFGPLGFLLGPLVLSLLFALLEIYASAVLKKRDGAKFA